jgi:hypothetical protein
MKCTVETGPGGIIYVPIFHEDRYRRSKNIVLTQKFEML